jgi:hypothetical protein
VRPYPSSQKGGTLIAEDVHDIEEHKRRLCDPDGYRPPKCPRCGHAVLHVHGYRERLLLAHPETPIATVVVHQCAHQACAATWRILPAFIARRLWRAWATVEAETLDEDPSPARPSVPNTTVRRWRARLASSARHLVQVLAAAGNAALTAVVAAVGLDPTREQLALAVPAIRASQSLGAGQLGALAALAHRLCPGARLM